MNPIITIVTIVKDHVIGLRETEESLFSQDFQNWQQVIVVGKSLDNTLLEAKAYSILDRRIKVIEQKEVGIYNAMNVGILECTTEYVWFMNGGDKFFSNVSLKIGLNQILGKNLSFIVGGYQIENGSKNFSQKAKLLSQLHFALNRKSGCHQSMIFRTEDLKKIGGYDQRWVFAADYDACLKLIKNSSARSINEILALIEPGGVTDQSLKKMHFEKQEIRNQLFAGRLLHQTASKLWFYLALLNLGLKRRSG